MINEVWGLKKPLSKANIQHIIKETRKRAREGKDTVTIVDGRVVNEDELARKKARCYTTVLEQHQQDIDPKNHGGAGHKIEFLTPSRSPTPIYSALSPFTWQSSASPILDSTIGLFADIRASVNDTQPTTVLPTSPVPSFSSLFDFDWSATNENQPSSFSAISLLSPSPRTTLPSKSSYDKLQAFAFRNSLHQITPTFDFQEKFHEIFSIHFQDLDNLDSRITRFLSTTPITTIEEFQSNGLALVSDRPALPDLLGFLISYMARLSNSVDKAAIRRRCIDSLVQSGMIQQNLKIFILIYQRRRPSTSESHLLAFSDQDMDTPEGFDLIIRNFSIQLFYSAARTGELDVFEFFLGLGILTHTSSRNQAVVDTFGATAMQYAIEYGQESICKLLFERNVNVNAILVSPISESLVWTAVMAGLSHIVSTLMKMGAKDQTFQLRPWLSSYLVYLQELALDRGILWAQQALESTRTSSDTGGSVLTS
ncbi:hypothetical protein H072_2057 [Dactylellina haptotyla CBS 200.50]|uniref:Uncharacterized protein n=1 Tax=Dactylellina haptotyla (strain CBS 200.50) TaxID=1284197 RepID=S8ALU3_DACHA|nr:hypothetical protein H072_2057 [Dactylellina haptotyla CBS 200.50]